MRTETRLLFGPIAAAIFVCGVVVLSSLLPAYSHTQQSISAIGKMGSSARLPFAAMLIAYAFSLFLFASGIYSTAAEAGRPKLAAYLVGLNALTQVGIAIFATPHPLHNIFGLASLPTYLAPLAMAFSWRGNHAARTLVVSSWLLGTMVLVSLLFNLSELFPESYPWLFVKPVPGLVQRSLVLGWFPWCVASGLLMRRRERSLNSIALSVEP